MKSLIITTLIVLTLLNIKNELNAQIHIVYVNDTNSTFITKLPSPIFYGQYQVGLKDSLIDGFWVLLNSVPEDSITQRPKGVIQTASYNNKVKSGLFNRYSIFEIDNSYKLYSSSNYVRDTLNGLSFQNEVLTPYYFGLKNGIEYDYYGNTLKPKFVRLYQYDTLISWQYLSKEGVILVYSSPNINDDMTEYIFFNYLGDITKKIIGKGDSIYKSLDFYRGVLVKETYYCDRGKLNNRNYILDYYLLLKLIDVCKPIRIINYDIFENVKHTLEYQNGLLINESFQKVTE